MFLVNGVIMGLMGSIPLGPIGVLCIQRTLSKRFRSGFYSGLGAATADTTFAIIAIFFVTIVMSFIEARMQLFTVIGGVLIMGIGASIFFKKSELRLRNNRVGKGNYLKDYISVFLLTLANPAYILVFIALFTSFGIDTTSLSFLDGLLIIGGVFLGASLWWLILTYTINRVRKKFRVRHLIILNHVAGAVIFGLGAIAVITAFFKIDMKALEQMINKVSY